MSSIGLPASIASRAAKLGCSSDRTARRSVSRSSCVIRETASDGCFLYRPDGLCGTVPALKLQLLRFERVGGREEFLKLLDRAWRQAPDVVQVALEGGATGH